MPASLLQVAVSATAAAAACCKTESQSTYLAAVSTPWPACCLLYSCLLHSCRFN